MEQIREKEEKRRMLEYNMVTKKKQNKKVVTDETKCQKMKTQMSGETKNLTTRKCQLFPTCLK